MPEALPEPTAGEPATDARVSDEISPEELAHPESLGAVHVTAVPPSEGGLWSVQRRPLTLGLVLTITLVAAEALAISTAMPIVARELGGLELYGLVFSAFFVGSMFGVVVVGGLIDRIGVVRPFVLGLVLFGIGLTIGGLTPSMPILIVARFIQGVGGGTIPPVAYVAIGRTLPEHLRPRMFALLSTAWLVPGLAGPAIAGFVAETWSWRLVFLGLLPLIVISGTMAFRGLRGIRESSAARSTDSLRRRLGEGIALAVGVSLLTAGLESDSPVLVVGLTAVGAGITAFVFARFTPPGTLRAAPGYPTSVLLRGLTTFMFYLVDVYVALLLEQVRGLSATEAGIALTGATIFWTFGSWTQARLSTRYRPEQFVRVGFPIVAVSIGLLGLVLFPSVRALLAVPIFAAAGFGMGLTYAQFAILVLRDAPAAIQGKVTAGLTLSDSIGTNLGTSVTAGAIGAAVRAGLGPGPGIGLAVLLAAALGFAGFLLSPRLRPTVR
ncbi:MAG TPA: MFS transporter [Candidatus Limnocylindrales bacterium]|nr:MFS transporter [Candidatus Limnocylindrales bacterium]